MIELGYGIAWDQNDLMRLLDSEAPQISRAEDEQAEELPDIDLNSEEDLDADDGEEEQVAEAQADDTEL